MKQGDFDKPVRACWLQDLIPGEAYIWSSKATDKAFSKGDGQDSVLPVGDPAW